MELRYEGDDIPTQGILKMELGWGGDENCHDARQKPTLKECHTNTRFLKKKAKQVVSPLLSFLYNKTK
jgi:hypothetical protein